MGYKFQANILIYLFFFTCKISAQSLYDRSIYSEKTSEIIVEYDTAFHFKTVNVFSFVDYRLYTNKKIMNDIIDSSFNCLGASNDTTYIRYPENAVSLKDYCDYKLAKTLNRYISIRRPRLSSIDSTSIIMELGPLKKLFKDYSVKEYKMSDRQFSLLNKHPADIEIFLDILMYQNKHSFPKTTNNCALLRLFAFDLRQRKIVFYNYITSYGGSNYRIYDTKDGENPAKRFKYLLKPFKAYLNANKKYLKKIRKR